VKWTNEEISLLKDGLKKNNKIKDPKEKFQNISQLVSTKTYADCIKKVKDLQNSKR